MSLHVNCRPIVSTSTTALCTPCNYIVQQSWHEDLTRPCNALEIKAKTLESRDQHDVFPFKINVKRMVYTEVL